MRRLPAGRGGRSGAPRAVGARPGCRPSADPDIPAAPGGPAPADGSAAAGMVARPAAERDEAASLHLLTTGELDIQGRLVDASNATMYCTIRADGVAGSVRLQAGRRRTAAMGLSGRDAGRARAGCLSDVTSWRVGRGTADGVPGRAVRAGHVPALGRRGRVSRSGRAGPQRRRPPAPADVGLRRRGEQRRPQDRPPATDCYAASSTAATTVCASPPSTSCALCSGSGGARSSRRQRSRH